MKLEIDDWLSIYRSAGCALIPLQKGKKEPLIPWKEYEKKAPSKEQVEKWFKDDTPKNFAVLCGEASDNLIVLDFDYPEIFERFFDKDKIKQTWVVKTPHGYHVYFRSVVPIESFDIPKCVEVRGTGRYVVAPPSIFVERDNTVSEYKFLSRPKEIQVVSNLKEAVVKRAIELGFSFRKDFDETKWLNLTFAYKGDEPPCITKLVKDKAPVGERDERALRIACYYANFCNDLNLAREKIIRWFDNCETSSQDPFSLSDALQKIDSARKGNYVFGCDDWLLKSYCSPCELGESKLVEQILSSPNIMEHITNLMDDVIAGESANKQLIFLLLLSGKVQNPGKKQIILLQGEAGGGKTTLANNISQLFKTKRVGRFSKHALDYSDLQGYEVLYIQEIGSMDREEQGISTLKFLSADDKGYTIEVTARDPETNEWVTVERVIPAITVITTTTRVDIEPQFARRAWLLNVDETVSQTKRIKDFKIESSIEDGLVDLGFLKETKRKRALRILRKIVQRLEDVKVFVPYSEAITNLLGEPKTMRVRGDYPKFITLAWLSGFLHQKVAPKLPTNPGDTPAVLAPFTQTALMFTNTKEPLIAMTTNLEKRFTDLFKVIKELGYKTTETTFAPNERKKIQEMTGKAYGTINSYFRELEKRCPFILKTKSGSEVHYIFTKSLKEIEVEMLASSYILESYVDLALKFIEDTKKRLTQLSAEEGFGGIPKEFFEAIERSVEKEEKELRSLKTCNLDKLSSKNQRTHLKSGVGYGKNEKNKKENRENTHDSLNCIDALITDKKELKTPRFRVWQCPRCNTKNDEGIVFCQKCGFRNVASYG